jgi:hypothetical protein
MPECQFACPECRAGGDPTIGCIGWAPDPARPGYWRHPERPGYLRSRDGAWWDRAIVDHVRREVDAAGRPVEAERRDLIAGLRQAALRRGLLQ